MLQEEMVARLREAVDGTYSLGRELGGGGMSRVFRATEIATGQQIVIKVLPPDLVADISLARFKREIDVASRMQHPNIVPMLTSGEANGLPWFAMPFVDGESLRERLSGRGSMSIADAQHILRDMASALAYAHRRGVVHRDIKPENVLFSGDVAMIVDFGVAKALMNADDHPAEDIGPKLTTRRIALGTPTYMSPEQASGDPRVGTRADIYALGIVGYELLAGRTPFEGRSLHGQLRAHVKEAPVPLSVYRPNAPAYLVELIMRCLAKLPADRPQLAEVIVDALDEGIRTTPEGAAVESDDARLARSYLPESTVALDIALTQQLYVAKPAESAGSATMAPMPSSATPSPSSVAPSSSAPAPSAIPVMLGFAAVAVLAAVVLILR